MLGVLACLQVSFLQISAPKTNYIKQRTLDIQIYIL